MDWVQKRIISGKQQKNASEVEEKEERKPFEPKTGNVVHQY